MSTGLPSHLHHLQDEAIFILREAAAEFERPVLMYSIGKDSAVLLHLAIKAFHPARPPFALLHIDTGWKFREMIAFRDAAMRRLGLDIIVHHNADAARRGISPLTHDSRVYTDTMKTEALKAALDQHRFDAAIGGARRDEERSRAKERIFSVRSAGHRWDPKSQRPELWRLFNGRLAPGETMRIFPLSNWTELDVWGYIRAEAIPVVPLYFALARPVIERGDMLLVVDDERLAIKPGERVEMRMVRFRTLGCYPLTAAIASTAATLDEIIGELSSSRQSERAGRLIDHDESGSMEKKKQEGYF